MSGSALTKDQFGQSVLNRLKAYPCYGGLDLAAVSDLTAFVLVWPVRDLVYVYSWFFLPEDGLADRSHTDNIDYRTWANEGFLELTPGNVTDWRYVTDRIKQLAKALKIQTIGFDAYGARDTVSDLIEAGIQTQDVKQSIGSLSASTKRLQELVLSQKLRHTGHPVLRWNVDSTSVYQDANANIKAVKPDRRKSTKRIDGVVATIMAIDCLQKAPPPKPKSIYSTRGLLTL